MRRFIPLLALLTACTSGPVDAPPVADVTASADTAGDTTEPPALEALVVHEWGTFTVFVGSDGEMVEGLHHAEVPLPDFVDQRSLGPEGSDADEIMPALATTKLQNPALYLHSPDPGDVTINLAFPKGVLTRSWPPFDASTPTRGALQSLSGGQASWDLEAAPVDPSLEQISDTGLWAPMRTVDATALRAAGGDELFLFHGGIGRLELPVTLSTDPTNEQHVNVTPTTPLTRAWYVYVHEGGGVLYDLGEVEGPASFLETPTPKETNPFVFVEDATDAIEAALVEEGLYADEAAALVATWSHTVFSTHGKRLLCILPQSWTDVTLPVTVNPPPQAHERVFVGRVEFLSSTRETALLEELETAMKEDAGDALITAWGPFAEPRLRRLEALVDTPELEAYAEDLIAQAAVAP
ncbi:MAG: hypothetical protein QF464_06735 [Myxococcota bacterium]|nr:hypothetical protein [Myxococcota bacterium]